MANLMEALEPHKKRIYKSYSKDVLARFMSAADLRNFEEKYKENRHAGGGSMMAPTRRDLAIMDAYLAGENLRNLARAEKQTTTRIRARMYRAAFWQFVEAKRT